MTAAWRPPAPEHTATTSEHGEGNRIWRRAAREVGERAFQNADRFDVDGAYPASDVAALHDGGLLSASLPRELGGAALGGVALCDVLREIGSGSLPLGRLFEGHVNALGLVVRYGNRHQASLVAAEARDGKLFGVWNTDGKDALRLVAEQGCFWLKGRKILASGAGHIERPIVTASDESGSRLMVMPRLPSEERDRADLSQWRAHGMRASATGSVDFSGIKVEEMEIVGGDGNYDRQPSFSGGAWRFAAVHLGGMERLFDLLCRHLRSTGRGGNPHQAARLGEAAIVVETARLWVERAALTAEGRSAAGNPARVVAYVNLARLAVERAALDLLELVHRSVGLQAFVRPNPIERISRDLATYLRQPGPDQALTSAASWVVEQETAGPDLWGTP